MGILNWLFRKREPASDTNTLNLIRQLNDSNDFSVRLKAAEALCKVGKPAVEQLLEAVEDPATKWGAITALGDIGDDRAIDSLLKATKSIDPQIRGGAVIALGKIGGERVVEPLIQILETEDGVIIRQFAIEALGGIRDRRAIASLTKALNDRDASIKKYAQDALKKINQQ